MRILASTLFILLLLAGSAMAQMSDDDYVDHYFGTQLLITMQERPYNYDAGEWWGQSLPMQLTDYDNSYLAGVVNAGRIAKGDENLVNDPNSVLLLGYEIETEGGYQYDISFRGIRPSEVKILLKALSMPDSVLAGAKVEYMPLMTTTFGYYGSMEEEPQMITIGDMSFPLELDMAASGLHDTFVEMFRKSLGKEVMIDIYYGQSLGQYGNSCDLTVTATINE
ncbi:hypothetical protein KDL29_02990 [bacterium]|nr:hypothetical protein [bacterium]